MEIVDVFDFPLIVADNNVARFESGRFGRTLLLHRRTHPIDYLRNRFGVGIQEVTFSYGSLRSRSRPAPRYGRSPSWTLLLIPGFLICFEYLHCGVK